MLTDQRHHLARRVGDLPRLNGDEDVVDRSHLARIVRRRYRRHVEITVRAVDTQAFGPQRLKMSSARDEHDVFAGVRQAPAEVTADSSGTEHREPHVSPPLVYPEIGGPCV